MNAGLALRPTLHNFLAHGKTADINYRTNPRIDEPHTLKIPVKFPFRVTPFACSKVSINLGFS